MMDDRYSIDDVSIRGVFPMYFDTPQYVIKWWQRILLFFLQTNVIKNEGYVLHYKKFRGVIYLLRMDAPTPG